MTDLRAAIQTLAAALPPGSAVPVPREWLLELLAPTGPLPALPTEPRPLAPDLTCRQAATVLGRHESTVRAWLEAGELEGYKQRGREWRVTPAALERFRERERARKPGAAASADPIASNGARADLGAWRRVRRAS